MSNPAKILIVSVILSVLCNEDQSFYARACKEAGGQITFIEECDGSRNLWCVISEKEQCYADQVKEGRCAEGTYSEELGGIVGITPRVLCEEGQ